MIENVCVDAENISKTILVVRRETSCRGYLLIQNTDNGERIVPKGKACSVSMLLQAM